MDEATKPVVMKTFQNNLDLIKKDDRMKEASPGAQIVSAAILSLVNLLHEKLGDRN